MMEAQLKHSAVCSNTTTVPKMLVLHYFKNQLFLNNMPTTVYQLSKDIYYQTLTYNKE